ncbi:MAG: hypothetical protein WC455_15115 [Dehalococcoidia bacterium]|jgi:hypothetical protein
MQWGPIETAPKDGSWFLVFDGVCIRMATHSIFGRIITADLHNITKYATHWTPLPDPPTNTEGSTCPHCNGSGYCPECAGTCSVQRGE